MASGKIIWGPKNPRGPGQVKCIYALSSHSQWITDTQTWDVWHPVEKEMGTRWESLRDRVRNGQSDKTGQIQSGKDQKWRKIAREKFSTGVKAFSVLSPIYGFTSSGSHYNVKDKWIKKGHMYKVHAHTYILTKVK